VTDLTAAELEELRRLYARSVTIVKEQRPHAILALFDACVGCLPRLLDAAEQNAALREENARLRGLLGEALTAVLMGSSSTDLETRIDAELSPRPDPKRSERDNPERD
jgi:hypothetical protein